MSIVGIINTGSASSSGTSDALLQDILNVLNNIKTDTALLTATNTLLDNIRTDLGVLHADNIITNQQLVDANTELDNIAAILTAMSTADANYYTAMSTSQASILAQLTALNTTTGNTNTNLAALITNTQTLINQTDQLETLLTAIQTDANNNSTANITKLEELRVLLAAINANTDGLEAQLTLLNNNTDGIEGLITSSNIKLDDILLALQDDAAATSGPLNTVYVTQSVDTYEQRNPDDNALIFSVPTVADLTIAANTITELTVTLIESTGVGTIDFGGDNKQYLNSASNIIGYKINFQDEADKVNAGPIVITGSGGSTVLQVVTKNKL